MTDLATIKTGERTLEIKHPGTGEPVGLRIGIVHIDDEKLAATKRAIRDQRIDSEQRGKRLKVDDIDENERKLAFAATTGWEWYNDLTFEGEVPEYNPRNFNRVIKALPWVKGQIAEEIGDTKAFFDEHNPS